MRCHGFVPGLKPSFWWPNIPECYIKFCEVPHVGLVGVTILVMKGRQHHCSLFSSQIGLSFFPFHTWFLPRFFICCLPMWQSTLFSWWEALSSVIVQCFNYLLCYLYGALEIPLWQVTLTPFYLDRSSLNGHHDWMASYWVPSDAPFCPL